MQKRELEKGLIIGRFQPFHKGHAYLIYKALEIVDKIVIGIGSTDKNDLDNPLGFEIRENILNAFIKHENLRERIVCIIPLEDDPDDNVWLLKTLDKTGQIDVVIGNNDWVNGIFQNAGYAVREIGHFRRDQLEGKKIRERIRSGKEWESRVPSFLLDEIGFSF